MSRAVIYPQCSSWMGPHQFPGLLHPEHVSFGGFGREQKKENLGVLLSRFSFLSSPQRYPHASRQDEDLAPPCGRWVSVTVIDTTIF